MKNLISIVVPVYNVAPYLRECLDSIRNQTYENFEAILVDDGSTDDSGAICDEYAGKDDRFTVIHQENRGQSGARNAGLERCHGEYLSLVDSDDWVAPRFLEKLYQALKETDADVALCDFIEARDAKETRRNWSAGVFEGAEILREYMNNGIYNYVYHKLYRMELVKGFRFSDYRSAMEDVPWQARVMTAARRVTRISDALYYYRIRRGSLMRTSQSPVVMRGTIMDGFRCADSVLSWLSTRYDACQDGAGEREILDGISASALDYLCMFLRRFIMESAFLPDSESLFELARTISARYDALPAPEREPDAKRRHEQRIVRFVLRTRSLVGIRLKFFLLELSRLRFRETCADAVRYLKGVRRYFFVR